MSKPLHNNIKVETSKITLYYNNHLFTQKFSQENQIQTFVENFLSSKSDEFYLRGINKLLDKWQEVIQNNGEYTIDWN